MARTWRSRCRWRADTPKGCIFALALLYGACASTAPPPPNETESLLALVTRVIESTTAEERRGIEAAERARFDSAPTYHNMLRVALVRAFSAALPAELTETRNDLEALANGRHELTANQRRLALIGLMLVDQRMQMGTQIIDLQRQIDSLTAIEASLDKVNVNQSAEQSDE